MSAVISWIFRRVVPILKEDRARNKIKAGGGVSSAFRLLIQPGPTRTYKARGKPEMWSEESLKNRVKLFDSNDECDEKLHQDWQCESCQGMNSCKFRNMKMIFNITLCGIWAGYQFDETTSSLANCKEYVTNAGKDNINNQFIKIEYVSVKSVD